MCNLGNNDKIFWYKDIEKIRTLKNCFIEMF